MLILTIVQLDITLDLFSLLLGYFVYTSACNLIYAVLCVISVKVDVCVHAKTGSR